jgi:hypothetical protein
MADMRPILRLIFVTGVFALVCGIANGQQVNPNKLPPCPGIDRSASYDVGVGGRTGKWTNCWGRCRVDVSKDHKGDVFEGDG